MRFKRLITYVATHAGTHQQRQRLGEVMMGRVQPQSQEEETAVRDFTSLSMADVEESWVTQSSAQQYATSPATWRLDDHLLTLRELTSSEEVARSNARSLWTKQLRGTIGCRTFHQSPTLSVTAFVLPPGTQLDLHDHPSMTVLQTLLCGKMNALSVDWVANNAGHGVGGEAVVVHSGVIAAGERQVILPQEGGVVHHLSNPATFNDIALFVDFITPPYYTPPDAAACTYYKLRRSGSSGSSSADLNPDDFMSLVRGERVLLTPNHTFGGPDMVGLLPVR